MGQLDMLKSYEPVNLTPIGAVHNKLSNYQQMPALTWANPTNFGYAGVSGPFTPAGVYEVSGVEFLQDRWHWPSANTQIVTAPQQPVDKGTFDALRQNATGVYLQGPVVGIVHQYSGSAPTTGVYTGYYTGNGDYEGCG